MSVIIPFNPSPAANFQFQCTLDGKPYNVICTFNAYGQRYYLNVYDLTGNLVLARPIIGSPATFNVSLTLGYFDTSIVYRESSAQFEIPGLPPVPLERPAPPPPTPPGRLDHYVNGLLSAFGLYRLLGRDFQALIQVRRSSDNALKDIGCAADGQALDIASLLEFCGMGDGFVSILYDQARYSNAVAPSAAQQPCVVRAGAYLGAIQFDGVDDVLVCSTPATGTLSCVGLMQFLSLPHYARLYGHLGTGGTSPHGIAYQYQTLEGKISLYNYGSDGIYKQVLTAGAPALTPKPYGSVAVSDQLPAIWISGVNATASTLVDGTVTGNFVEQPFGICGDFGADCGNIDFQSLAIWLNDQTVNMPQLSALM